MTANYFDVRTGKDTPRRALIAGFPPDFLVAVSEGIVDNLRIEQKFGAIKYLVGDTGNWKPVSTSKTYPTPTSPVALEILSSDNVNDVPGGSGALSVHIHGLKTAASIVPEFEILALNGSTPVNLSNDWFRIFRLEIETTGTYASQLAPSHSSIITIRERVGGAVWAVIDVETGLGLSQSEISVVSIPKGEVGHILQYHIDVSNTNKVGDVILLVREGIDNIVAPFNAMKTKAIHRNIAAGSSIDRVPRATLAKITGPADVGFMCQGASAFEMNINFEMLLGPAEAL